MREIRQHRIAVLAGVLMFSIVVGIVSFPSIPLAFSQAPTSFVFGAGGDIGANSSTDASLTALAGSGANFFLALGDMSYDQVTPESAWCNYIKQRVGANYPFELLVGNHEEKTSGPDGFIDNYAACLPDRLGVTGQYAHQYYFDYPPGAPLARFILIDPALNRGSSKANYCTSGDTANCDWLKARIDEAKSQGLWTIVGMHKVCLTMGIKSCEIGSSLLNVLIDRKVDLILQGHDHSYQRSKQLGLSANCTAVKANAYDADCVVDDGADRTYGKGAGPVVVIAANVGRESYKISTSDEEAPYFGAWMESTDNSYGFLKVSISASRMDAQFVHGDGTYSDQFAIDAAAAPPVTPGPTPTGVPPVTPVPVGGSQVYTFTTAADSYVWSTRPGTNYGESIKLHVDGAPVERSYLRFNLQGLVDTVVSAQLYLFANSGSSTGFQVNAVDDNTWTEEGITYANAPAPGALVANSGPFARNEWKAVDITNLVHGNGAVNLALTKTDPTAIVFGSMQGVNAPMLVVTTRKNGTPNQVPTPEEPAPGAVVDTDGDGLSDADEQQNGTDIKKPDSDGDGMPDLWEVEEGLNPRSAKGANGPDGDPDDDGLTNLEEFGWKTDPWEVDLLGEKRVFLPLINASK